MLTQTGFQDALDKHRQLPNFGLSLLDKNDFDPAVDVFAKAFTNDPAMCWLGGLDENDPRKEEKMYRLNSSLFRLGLDHSIRQSRGFTLGTKEDGDLVGCVNLIPGCFHEERIRDLFVSIWRHGLPTNVTWGASSDYCSNSASRLMKMDVITEKRKAIMKDTTNWISLNAVAVSPSQHGECP